MKTALIIAYEFPPIGGSGVLRTVKFVKYLTLYGWQSIVLTVKRDESLLQSSDSTFLDELPTSVKIYRVKVFDLYDVYKSFGGKKKQGGSYYNSKAQSSLEGIAVRFNKAVDSLLIPDAKIGWYPTAIRAGRRIFTENIIDVIYSTSPRNTAHLIARRLSRRFKTPWVADFRDPWTMSFLEPEHPFPFNRWDYQMERSVFRDADAIVAVRRGIFDQALQRFPFLDSTKMHLIPNGFDEEDFKDVTPQKFDKFTILYTGVLYKERSV